MLLAEDVASMPGIDLTLKLQTTKPPGTIQNRKRSIYELPPLEMAISALIYVCYSSFISLCLSGVLFTWHY